jgi:CBS-domain-containing membrane protein
VAHMKAFFSKMRGGAALPPKPKLAQILLAGLGGLLAIGTVAYLTHATTQPLLLGSFGASCVLAFGFPESPFSQPRNIIGGHVLSSLSGLLYLTLFGATWWSTALALATAIMVMLWTRTVHPPAGSNPVIVMMTRPDWMFALTPTLVGATILTVVAVLYNNQGKTRSYPKYWF